MKYTCKICGYIYDEAKEAIPFAQLPDTWVCPLCGARKADFAPQEEAPQPAQPRLTVLPQDDDLQKLSLPEFAAVCSNLARGCEKQYKGEEAALFQQLAQAFLAIMPEAEQADFSHLQALVQQDLDETYGAVRATAADQKDRGALRICVWGEKVTRILNALLQRYAEEGEAFLENTEIWVCTVCGFVYVGDVPPERCPVCKVPAWLFEKIEGRAQQ